MSGDDEADAWAGTQALATTPRADGAPRMKLSATLARAARDEFVYVGRRGEVRAPWRYKAQRAAGLSIAVGAGTGGVVLSIMIGAPWLSLLYLGTLGYVVNAWRQSERLKRGAALLAADRLDEARTLLVALTRSSFVSRTIRALAWQNLGGVEARRGNHALALQHVRKCREVFGRRRLGPVGPWRWINRFTEASLLAQLGRVEEAREVRASLVGVPDGEYFQILEMNADLMLAFAARRADTLPQDLFPWVRIALETTTAELALALLAWAHLERGDDDMGLHLLEQACDRIDDRLFSRAYPHVHAWLRAAHGARRT